MSEGSSVLVQGQIFRLTSGKGKQSARCSYAAAVDPALLLSALSLGSPSLTGLYGVNV